MKKIMLGVIALLSMLSISANADALQACYGCHGKSFDKVAMGKSKVVSNMTEADIVTALKGYNDGTYGGPMKGLMKGQVKRLSISPEAAASQIKAKGTKSSSSSKSTKSTKMPLKDKMLNCKSKVTSIETCMSKAIQSENKMQMKKCKMQIIKLAEHIKMQKKNGDAKCGAGKCGGSKKPSMKCGGAGKCGAK